MQHKEQSCSGCKIEFKEGERRSLCCNEATTRSPSLDSSRYRILEETVEAIRELADVLQRIHHRLRKEGYVIENNELRRIEDIHDGG